MATSVDCEANASAGRSIPDMANSASHVQESVADFVVLPESPVVGFLSDSGDAFDNLAVQLQSVRVASGISPMQSLSLRADIERLTAENEQLKKSVLENNQSMKTHLERCNMWREQMQKSHERDATMIEEARQKTLKLQQEKETLHACLLSTQKKFEDAIVEKFSLAEAKKTLSAQVEKLRSELAECEQRLEDFSFENIQGTDSELRSGSKEASKQSEEDEQKPTEATEECEELSEDAKKIDDPKENPLIESLQAEVERLKGQIEEETQSRREAETRLSQLEGVVAKKESEIVELHGRLVAVTTELETYKQEMEKEYNDLLEQVSSEKANFNTERERRIQELNQRLATLEKVAQQGQQDAAALEKAKAALLSSATRHQMEVSSIAEKLASALTEVDRLNKEIEQLREERSALREVGEQIDFYKAELNAIKEREAAAILLQSDQASQLEAFKEEWRQEHAARVKAEESYNDLLQTWQTFEQNQPVVVNGQRAERNEPEQGALDLANAERARLEALVTALNQEIVDLRAQNVQLMNDRRIDTPQQPNRQRPAAEFCCPLCNEAFANQAILIQHAGECEGGH